MADQSSRPLRIIAIIEFFASKDRLRLSVSDEMLIFEIQNWNVMGYAQLLNQKGRKSKNEKVIELE